MTPHWPLSAGKREKKKNRQIGPQSPSPTRCQVAHKGNDGSINQTHLSNYDDAKLGALQRRRSRVKGGLGGRNVGETRIRVGGEGGIIYHSCHSHHLSAKILMQDRTLSVSVSNSAPSAPLKRRARTPHKHNKLKISINSPTPFSSANSSPLFSLGPPGPATIPSDPTVTPAPPRSDLDQASLLLFVIQALATLRTGLFFASLLTHVFERKRHSFKVPYLIQVLRPYAV